MSKAKESKLDPFAERLDEWFGVEKKTLKEVQAQLALDGCSVSLSRLSEWWEARTQQKAEERLLSQIASGAQQCKEVERQFASNAAPELDTLIKLHRTLVLQMSTHAAADPRMLKLADASLRTVMEFVSGQTKAHHKERELAIAEVRLRLDTDAWAESTLKKAAELNSSSLSNADKIAAMRQALFADIEALAKSGKVQIPT